MRNNNSNNMDGSIVDFDALSGPSAVLNPNSPEDYPQEFVNGEFNNASGDSFIEEMEDHSNLFDNMRSNMKRRQQARAVRKSDRNKRRNLGAKARANLKGAKATEKRMGAKTNQMAVKQAGVETVTDKAIAQSIANESPASAEKTPMSKGVKIAIGVGIAVVLGAIVFVVIKKMKAKKG